MTGDKVRIWESEWLWCPLDLACREPLSSQFLFPLLPKQTQPHFPSHLNKQTPRAPSVNFWVYFGFCPIKPAKPIPDFSLGSPVPVDSSQRHRKEYLGFSWRMGLPWNCHDGIPSLAGGWSWGRWALLAGNEGQKETAPDSTKRGSGWILGEIPAWKRCSGTGMGCLGRCHPWNCPQKWIQCSEAVWGWAGQCWVHGCTR